MSSSLSLPQACTMVTSSLPHDKVRFVCVSDTHGKTGLLPFDVPEGDILIHAGDFTMRGWAREGREFNNWLGQLPHKYKVVIAGNHDGLVDFRFCVTPINPHTLLTNATYLQDESITIYGIKIYGSPWIPEHGSVYPAFSIPRGKALREHWQIIPLDTDVLVTHGPPWGHCDLTCKGYNVGCKDLLEEVRDRVKPKIHIFGHFHEGYGKAESGGTIFINASTCDSSYDPVNPPIVFDLNLPSGHSKMPRDDDERALPEGLHMPSGSGTSNKPVFIEPSAGTLSDPPRETSTEARVEALHELVVADRRTHAFHLARSVGLSYRAVMAVLTDQLGLLRVEESWVPKSLSTEQKSARLSMSNNLLARSGQNHSRFLSRIVAHGVFCEQHFDEAFQSEDDIMAAIASGSQAQAWENVEYFQPGDRAISLFWDSEGIITLSRIHKKQVADEEYYASELMKLKEVMRRTRRETVEKGVLLLQESDNPTHTSQSAVEMANKCHFKLVPIPANSPDLYPSDYFLRTDFVRLRKMNTVEEDIMLDLTSLLESPWRSTVNRSGMFELRSRWKACVKSCGDYFM